MSPVALGVAGAAGVASQRVILLPDAVYNASQSVDFTNPGFVYTSLWCNVTVNPGGAQTLRIRYQTRIPTVGGTLLTIASTPVTSFGGGTGTMSLHAGPGLAAGWNTTQGGTDDFHVPFFLVLLVEHSAGGDWEYELGLDGHA